MEDLFGFFGGGILSAGAADINAEPFTGCFGGGPGRMADTSGTVTVDTSTMRRGFVYVFYVVVTKDSREADAELMVTLDDVAAPVITITSVSRFFYVLPMGFKAIY